MRGREIAVGESFCQNRLCHGTVQFQPFGLPVLFVPAEVEPAQAVENRLQGFFGVALQIRIVNPQDHRAAVMAGKEPVKNESSCAADV